MTTTTTTTSRTIDVTNMSAAAFDALMDAAGESKGFDGAVAAARRVEAEEALAAVEAEMEAARRNDDMGAFRAAMSRETEAIMALEEARSAERATLSPEDQMDAMKNMMRDARSDYLNTRSGQALFARTGAC